MHASREMASAGNDYPMIEITPSKQKNTKNPEKLNIFSHEDKGDEESQNVIL